MTSGRRPPGGIPPDRRRPQRTIDLTATEVSQEPVGPVASVTACYAFRSAGRATACAAGRVLTSRAQTPEPPPAQPAEPVRAVQPPESPPAAEEPPPREPESRNIKSITWLPFEPPWPLIGAGAAGGALVLLLLGGLWFTGVFTRRDDTTARLALIETQLREIAARPQMDPKSVEELVQRLGKIESALAERLAAVESGTKSLGETLAGQERRIEAASAFAETAQTAARSIDALAARVAALERAPRAAAGDGRSGTDDRAVRLVVGAAALRSAVERGEPFAAELAAVKPFAADPNALAPLEPLAATGVPSAAALARELSELVPSLQRAAGSAPSDGGFFERLQTNAGRLVRIRPIDEVPGDDPAAIIARIEAKAGQADLSGALAELAKLPATARAPAEAWKKKAEMRIAAVEASRRFAADALAALGRPSP